MQEHHVKLKGEWESKLIDILRQIPNAKRMVVQGTFKGKKWALCVGGK